MLPNDRPQVGEFAVWGAHAGYCLTWALKLVVPDEVLFEGENGILLLRRCQIYGSAKQAHKVVFGNLDEVFIEIYFVFVIRNK